ncbi:hypothetical protein BDN72DRAFT_904021 [Pluteus cervinus]|uniref:Uncharacterized protein n=1 Tax=Pluteus cervinus TaxID=181527 RepID=A0ACD3A746_9AGAR|nr:hypothetical protein BDN72DRAFT_904021 [Pluteus cervinus]
MTLQNLSIALILSNDGFTLGSEYLWESTRNMLQRKSHPHPIVQGCRLHVPCSGYAVESSELQEVAPQPRPPVNDDFKAWTTRTPHAASISSHPVLWRPSPPTGQNPSFKVCYLSFCTQNDLEAAFHPTHHYHQAHAPSPPPPSSMAEPAYLLFQPPPS